MGGVSAVRWLVGHGSMRTQRVGVARCGVCEWTEWTSDGAIATERRSEATSIRTWVVDRKSCQLGDETGTLSGHLGSLHPPNSIQLEVGLDVFCKADCVA